MKKYKYITINAVAGGLSDKPGYCITNNRSHDPLGSITYDSQWRQWVAEFEAYCIFSAGCLDDVSDFIKNHAGKK